MSYKNKGHGAVTLMLGITAVLIGYFIGNSKKGIPFDTNTIVQHQQAVIKELQSQQDLLQKLLLKIGSLQAPSNKITGNFGSKKVEDTDHAESILSLDQRFKILGELYGQSDRFSKHYIANRMMESEDEHVKAFTLEIFLEGVEDIDFLLAHLKFSKGEPAVVAANAIAAHVDDVISKELKELVKSTDFPENFPIALALFKSGSPNELHDWVATALESFHERTPREQAIIITNCMTRTVPDGDLIAETISKSPDKNLRNKSISLLAQIGTELCMERLRQLSTDEVSWVASKARLTITELNAFTKK